MLESSSFASFESAVAAPADALSSNAAIMTVAALIEAVADATSEPPKRAGPEVCTLLSKMAHARLTAYAAIFSAMLGILLFSCASSDIHSEKAPEADLWMYHTYSWRPQSPAPSYSETVMSVRKRTNQNLADRGMILVPSSGNPDMWISEGVTPQSISLTFTDAHTGSFIWQGRSLVKPSTEPISENTVNSSVDHLVNQYIAEQKWMPASFWWTGINQVSG